MISIEDILNQKMQQRTPVNNNVPGELLAFISGGQRGAPQMPNIPMQQQQPVNLPQMGQMGSGIGKQIVGGLLKQYVEDKAEQDNAKKVSSAYGGLLDNLIDTEKNDTRKEQYKGLSGLIKSKNPELQKLGISGLGYLFKGSQPDLNRTEMQKNLQDPNAGPLVRAAKERVGVPVGWNRDPETGVISGMPTSSGLPYDQVLLQRMQTLKGTEPYGGEQRLNFESSSQDLARRNYELRLQEAEDRKKARELALQQQKDLKLPLVPTKHVDEYISNQASINEINDAIKTVEKNKKHFGPTTWLGEIAGQYIDPEGVEARAKVARIGGIQFHSLAGATGTAGEQKLYKPFIPDIRTDTPDAIITRLNGLKKHMEELNKQYKNAYSKGYRNTLPEPFIEDQNKTGNIVKKEFVSEGSLPTNLRIGETTQLPDGTTVIFKGNQGGQPIFEPIQQQQEQQKKVARTGTTKDGRRVIEYTDGTREYK